MSLPTRLDHYSHILLHCLLLIRTWVQGTATVRTRKQVQWKTTRQRRNWVQWTTTFSLSLSLSHSLSLSVNGKGAIYDALTNRSWTDVWHALNAKRQVNQIHNIRQKTRGEIYVVYVIQLQSAKIQMIQLLYNFISCSITWICIWCVTHFFAFDLVTKKGNFN